MAFLFTSCGGNDNQGNATDKDSANVEASSQDSEATNEDDGLTDNTVNLTGNDQMKYDETYFMVKAGEPITLTLKNIGTQPAKAMSHDVVVLTKGSSFEDFGKAITVAKELDKLSDDKQAEMIAHTKMLGPGESDTITFTLPEPGEYKFLCTFPGHYMSMNGILDAR